jgi:hypothetical protein
MMASRVAAALNKENNVEVEMVKGGLGEFSVYIAEQKVIDTNRFWYPTTNKTIKRYKHCSRGSLLTSHAQPDK